MKLEIEFLSSNILESKSESEKIDFIMDRVKKGKILVVEESLSSFDESRIIEETMKQIDDKFSGVEISTLREGNVEGIRERMIKILGGSTGGLTVIGPSKLIKKIKKEPQKILLFAEMGKKRKKK